MVEKWGYKTKLSLERVKSDDRLVRELKARLPHVYTVGDARQPGRIYHAVRDGFDTAWNLPV
jgi:hypothetical protein